jgi:hypothetical protein
MIFFALPSILSLSSEFFRSFSPVQLVNSKIIKLGYPVHIIQCFQLVNSKIINLGYPVHIIQFCPAGQLKNYKFRKPCTHHSIQSS